jgi:crotonobetainyl-CoA:carnitine CoA-transferase CaiB-like acyl-CoA transferase
MSHTTILKGIKVLDLSTVLAGPSVGTFLAELGADVTKIESPQGDVTRTWYSSHEDQTTTSAYYLSVNAHKNVQVLDLNQDRSALEARIAHTDILLMNFKSSDETKFDLKPETLLQRYPNLIIGKIKGFEHEEGRVAYDVAIQAETGFMSINGEKGSEPLKLPVAFMDVMAAHQLKEGLLCALLDKTKTGKGMLVECSLESAGIVSLMNQGSNFLKTGQVPKASGSLHPNIAPYGEQIVFKDNVRVVLATGSDKQFASLCNALQCASTSSDPRFFNNVSRVHNRHELNQILTMAAEKISFQAIREILIQDNIPFGEIKTIERVMQSKTAQEKLTVHAHGERSISHIGFKMIK